MTIHAHDVTDNIPKEKGTRENYETNEIDRRNSDHGVAVELTKPPFLLDEHQIQGEEEGTTTRSNKKQTQIAQFQSDGYAIFPNVLSSLTVHHLNEQLEHVLRGTYNTGVKPDKTPKIIKSALPEHDTTGSQENEVNGSYDGSTSTTKKGKKPKIKKKKQTPSTNNDTSTSPMSTQKSTTTSSLSKATGPLGYSGNKQKKVYQIINIHKSNTLFRHLVTSPVLGEIVATLMNWKDGARLAQDQIWAKPAGAPPLAYHRDSPYFMFTPHTIATVWIALDDMTETLGPLTYVPGSHLWGEGRIGSTQHFFQDRGGKALLYDAARRAGYGKEHSSSIPTNNDGIRNDDKKTFDEADVNTDHNNEGDDQNTTMKSTTELKSSSASFKNRKCQCEENKENEMQLPFVSLAGLKAGGISIHDGRTWHGSGPNQSENQPRRGIGLHFIPVSARWTEDACKSQLWCGFVRDAMEHGEDVGDLELDELNFPITWRPTSGSVCSGS